MGSNFRIYTVGVEISRRDLATGSERWNPREGSLVDPSGLNTTFLDETQKEKVS